jgi:hypothetical protein
MIRSYAHEREIFMKNASFSSWLYHFLICPRDLVGDACTQIVAILLIYVSLLACCSALCIFEKHMLALVDLIHALPTRGRKVPNSCFQGEFASRKIGGNAFVQGELAFMHLEASSFSPEF